MYCEKQMAFHKAEAYALRAKQLYVVQRRIRVAIDRPPETLFQQLFAAPEWI